MKQSLRKNQKLSRRKVNIRRRHKTKKNPRLSNGKPTRRQKGGMDESNSDDDARMAAGALPDAPPVHVKAWQGWKKLGPENGRCPYCLREGSIRYQAWGMAMGSYLPIGGNEKFIIKCANPDQGGCGRFICCA